jgi:mannose-6-phosphate isomerase-like protein (cupin superfamily)
VTGTAGVTGAGEVQYGGHGGETFTTVPGPATRRWWPVTAEVAVLDTGSVAPRPGVVDGLTVRPTFGPDTGLDLLEQAVLECRPGPCGPIEVGEVEEVLYVASGQGTCTVRGAEHPLEPGCGIYLPRTASLALRTDAAEPLRLVAVRLLDPAPGPPVAPQVTRMHEHEAQSATAARTFRILAGPETGLRSATHFVGEIPPGRAPEHFHTYDEVLYVLEGTGMLHAGRLDAPLGPGTALQLPAKAVHCLENTGTGPLRIVAALRPAGSPATAFYPDGTPASA